MNKRQLYRHADRVLRIVYKEFSIEEHIQNIRFDAELLQDSFDLDNVLFIQRLRAKYLNYYPNNYNDDDFYFMIHGLRDQLEEEFCATNVFYLIPLVAKGILKRHRKELLIEFEDLLEWDGLINKIDQKFFLAAYQAFQVSSEFEEQIEYTGSSLKHKNKTIYDILKRHGISENHMHLKASGYTEDINWHMYQKIPIFATEEIREFCESQGVFKDTPKTTKNVRAKTQELQKLKWIRLYLEILLREDTEAFFEGGETLADHQELLTAENIVLNLYSRFDHDLIKQFEDDRFNSFSELKELKPLLAYGAHELQIIAKLIRKIESDCETKQLSLLYLNLYICGATAVKFQFVQDNVGMGFAKFKEKEENKSAFFKGSVEKEDNIRSSFARYYSEGVINKLELRIAPQNSREEYLGLLKELESYNEKEYKKAQKKNSQLKKIAYGVIVHLIKPYHPPYSCTEKDKLFYGGLELIDDELDIQGLSVRRGDIIRKSAEKAIDLIIDTNRHLSKKEYDLDEDLAPLRNKLVGIDTANYEIGNRPETYACAFRKYRDFQYNEAPTNLTYHVGEEFSSLTDGLRAIDDVITFLGYTVNDRIGHGLALGLDVTKFYKKKRGMIFTTLQDFVDDIAWLYAFTSVSELSNENLNHHLENLYREYSQLLYDGVYYPAPQLRDYIDGYLLRGDEPTLYLELGERCTRDDYHQLIHNKDLAYQVNHRDPKHSGAFLNREARKIYFRYHYFPQVKMNGAQRIGVEVTGNLVQSVQIAQTLLVEKIRSRNLFIEANPTSNKKISHITQYTQLPIISINKAGLSCDEEEVNLPVSINTDDSSIFQTNLSNEYGLLASALIRDGYPDQKVYDYIEKLAIASNIHSFVE